MKAPLYKVSFERIKTTMESGRGGTDEGSAA
jgi:hypothetical protein